MRRHPKAFALGPILAAMVLAMLAPAAAQAAPEHPELPGLSKEVAQSACGVATDSVGNYYVSDGAIFGTQKVKIYDPSGNPLNETFSPPSALCNLAVDSSGNIYGSNTILGLAGSSVTRYKPSEFPPTGSTTYSVDNSLNGNGVLTSSSVRGVAVDPSNQNVYVAEQPTTETQTVTFAGFVNGNTFTLTCDGLTTEPITYAAASARATNINAKLVEKCGSGNFATLSSGTTSTVTFQGKYLGIDVPQMTCTPVIGAGTCSITAEVNAQKSRISSFTSSGTPISSTTGTGVVGANYFGVDIYGANGRVYATDFAHNKAYVFAPNGTSPLVEIDGSSSPAGAFTAMEKAALAVDQSNGNVLVSDVKGHGVVDEFNAAGKYLTQITHSPAFGEASPADIAVDNSATASKGTVFVTSGTAGGKVFGYGALAPVYPLTITTSGTGSGTVKCNIGLGAESCLPEYAEGEEVALTANPAVGSVLKEWTGACSGSGACSVTMSSPKSVGAVFVATAAPTVTTEAANPVGETTATLNGKVNPNALNVTKCEFEYGTTVGYGSKVNCASAPGSGSDPVSVSAPVSGLTPGQTYHFRLVAENSKGETLGGDMTFTPNAQRTLTITKVGSGEVKCKVNGGSAETCAASYSSGTQLELVATPASHFSFSGWSAGSGSISCTGAGNCGPFNLTANSAVTATFAQITRTIGVTVVGTGTVQCKDEGAGSFGSCAGPFNEGNVVTLKATPGAHFSFGGWSEFTGSGTVTTPCAGTVAECQVKVDANVTGKATFAQITRTIGVTVVGTGTVQCKDEGAGSFGSCAGPFNEGNVVTLKATPGAHFSFGGWSEFTGSGTVTTPCAGTVAECQVKVDANVTGKATFAQITRSLTITLVGDGKGSVTCNGAACAASYAEGTTVALAAAASSGSTFAGWSGGGCSGTGGCAVTLNANTAVTATFGANPTPTPDPTPTPTPDPTPPPAASCLVPKLKGMTLAKAKSALAAAKCTLGKVTKPKPKNGKKLGPLVVKSSTPAAGSVKPENAKVDLKLAPKPKKGKK